MKLQNKKTGQEGNFIINKDHFECVDLEYVPEYRNLAELNEEWEDAPEEEWRDVLGFEELYQVSNLGKVRTIKNGEAEMSQQENRNGYMTVHLRNKGVERRAMVHRLVAEAFISNPDELRDVNHKNGDKSDNRVENLEWVSHSDNMTHSFRELGENVRHIVQLSLDGVLIDRWNSITEAAEATGICRTDIGACCRGERTMAGAFEWKYEEDYEEPKGSALDLMILTLTNFIENEPDEDKVDLEDCKKMLKRLRAWKRLKDAGCEFNGYMQEGDTVSIELLKGDDFSFDDLDLLFGGEE
jgi:hypothetical protein